MLKGGRAGKEQQALQGVLFNPFIKNAERYFVDSAAIPLIRTNTKW